MNEPDTVQEGNTAQQGHLVQEEHYKNHVSTDASSVSNSTCDVQNTAPRYSQQIRKTPARFKINALRHKRDVDEPVVDEALTSNEALAWNAAITEVLDTL